MIDYRQDIIEFIGLLIFAKYPGKNKKKSGSVKL